MTDKYCLAGKVALVTGGAKGLGATIAQAISSCGANVMLTDVLVEEGQETASRISNCSFMRHDVTNEADWQAVVEKTVAQYGAIDILINNAGIESTFLFETMSFDEFKRIQSVNVDGTFLGIKWAIRAMKPGGISGRGGSIINLSSVAGLVGVPGLGAYCTAKGGVRLMSKAAAIECARLGYGIRVNSIHPAIIKTDMGSAVVRSLVDIGFAKDQIEAEVLMQGMHPMGYGEPIDVANAACFLASGSSKWMNGAELVVDGGLTAC